MKKTKKEIEQIINENLKLVEEGKPLTIPLRHLNGYFRFKYRKGKDYNKYQRHQKKWTKEYYKRNKEKILKKRKQRKLKLKLMNRDAKG